MALGNFGGRPPKPHGLKMLDGDTRQRGSNKHEASLKKSGDLPAGLPDMPKGLGRLAKQHWRYLTGIAGVDKLFREADAGTLAGLCQMYEGFMSQTAVAREMAKLAIDSKLEALNRGAMADRAEAAQKLAERLYARYLNGADRLGLSPAARARLQLGASDIGTGKKAFGVLPPPDEWKQRKSGVSA